MSDRSTSTRRRFSPPKLFSARISVFSALVFGERGL
jgi:hypothetical protein